MSFVRSSRTHWSSLIEATAATTRAQQVTFQVKGGFGLAKKTVHVWSSNFDFGSGGPSQWFVHQSDIKPVNGKFTMTVERGRVYSLTTTTGQGKGAAVGPPPVALQLPYVNDLATGQGEPNLLAPLDGAFELAPCRAPDGNTTCTMQTAVEQPVLWHSGTVTRRPHAISGADWADYTVEVDVRLPQAGSAGLIGRYVGSVPSFGAFDGYVFDVNTDGNYQLVRYSGGLAANTASGQRRLKPPTTTTLDSGAIPFEIGTWHRLSLSLVGTSITASVDGQEVATLSDPTLTHGIPGIQVGGWYPAEFSNLRVNSGG